ncbi:hypothetical protein MUP07_06455 [Candidatus Bathyarchaeota archaeon]|nr:hypothetical protein [Candidatus Bathyarchaeota archaeon]
MAISVSRHFVVGLFISVSCPLTLYAVTARTYLEAYRTQPTLGIFEFDTRRAESAERRT